jgi:steroid delta-isomerase-like uncharacterized protein
MNADVKELLRRDPEKIWTDGNLQAIDEIFANQFVVHDPSSPERLEGRDEYREYIKTYRRAFSDLEYAVETILAEDDHAALQYTARGKHDGEFLGLEPTGRNISVSGMELYRIEDGQIVEMWTSYDALGLFQQLDVLPATEKLSELASTAI